MLDLAWADAKRTFDMTRAVTTPTRKAADFLESTIDITGVIPVSCGIDRSNYRPDLGPRDGNRILFVGRLTTEKGIDVLLKAVAKLDPALDVHVDLVGGGDQRKNLEQLAHSLGLDARVTFHGHAPEEELRTLYSRATVFAIASIAELQSIATMEAMASGLPIVAANAVALPHLVHDGENGYLFEPGNVEEMAARLTDVLTAATRRATPDAAGLARRRRDPRHQPHPRHLRGAVPRRTAPHLAADACRDVRRPARRVARRRSGVDAPAAAVPRARGAHCHDRRTEDARAARGAFPTAPPWTRPSIAITPDREYALSWPGARTDRFVDAALAARPPVDVVHVQADFWGALTGHRFAARHGLPVVHTMHNRVDVGIQATAPLPRLVLRVLNAWQRRSLEGRSLRGVAAAIRVATAGRTCGASPRCPARSPRRLRTSPAGSTSTASSRPTVPP